MRRIVFLLKSLEISICRASHISDLKKHKFAMSSCVLFVFSHSELSSTHRQSLAECRDEIGSLKRRDSGSILVESQGAVKE